MEPNQSNNHTYTQDQLKDIFTVVNNTHLNLKGTKRKSLRASFLKWKQDNKQPGAFDLMLALFTSEDRFEKQQDNWERICKAYEYTLEDFINHKPIPYGKYMKRMRMKDERIDELEREIDEVMEKNDLISLEDHRDEIRELKKEHRLKYDLMEDQFIKADTKNKYYEDKMKAMEERYEYLIKSKDKLIDELENKKD